MNSFIYYVQLSNNKKGPLSIDELKQLRVSPQTLVWRNDSPDWLPASSFSELKESLVEIPPLLPQEKQEIQRTNRFEKFRKALFKYYLVTIRLWQPLYLSLHSLWDFFVNFAVSAVFLPQRTRSRAQRAQRFTLNSCKVYTSG